ncbi:MAG TPA: hypothetical protein DFS52_06510 [Myxococcales bacterium]|nr:hypothetical protein [Myxococcales bacterium]
MKRATDRICRRALASLLPILGALAACPNGAPQLVLVAHPEHVAADGSTFSVAAVAMNEDGSPGNGTVRFEADFGRFDFSEASALVELANGRATVDFGCDAREDPRCVGPRPIRASWNGASATLQVVFVEAHAPIPDAGLEEPDAGPEDAGADGDAGFDGGTVGEPSLLVETARSAIYLGIADSTTISSLLLGADGAPMAGQPLRMTTTLGRLAAQAGGAGSRELEATTDERGRAEAVLVEDGSEGSARITVEALAGLTASAEVEIAALGELSYVETLCAGEPCDILGVRGSGWNERAEAVFRLVDSRGRPAAGVVVGFRIPDSPRGLTTAPSAPTDSEGEASAALVAGDGTGAFRVAATLAPAQSPTYSDTLAVTLVRPASQGMWFGCRPLNLPVLEWGSPAQQVECTVKVLDRLNNLVPHGPRVCFADEVGIAHACVEVDPYRFGGDNSKQGSATFTFELAGFSSLSNDVEPLGPDPTQLPLARSAEPFVAEGSRVRNPRDGLATLIAWVEGGEEYFQDANGNGAYDSGELFVDQSEPFVDNDDDGTRGAFEWFVDSDSDGEWDGPNGLWDGDATVWAETRILLTGDPMLATSRLEPADFGSVTKGASRTLQAHLTDRNLNRPAAEGLALSATHTATKGAIDFRHPSILDAYGFGLERLLVDAATGSACSPSSERCVWRTLFYDWSEGVIGSLRIDGAPETDTSPPQQDLVTLRAARGSQVLLLQATGVIE